ncbi:MAG: hypothetical protein HY096_12035 [Nitrospinae bacterium]|nr:hypothetical protein [Nitrospinota bacterium]
MKVIVEIENEEEIKKVKKFFKTKHITIVKSDKEEMLEEIFNNFKVKLPKSYKFNREELHAREEGRHV